MKRISGISVDIMEQARLLKIQSGDPDLMVWTDPGLGFSHVGYKARASWGDYGYKDYADFVEKHGEGPR